jgi:hypothetical protein
MLGTKRTLVLTLALGAVCFSGCNPFNLVNKDNNTGGPADASVKPYSISLGVETQVPDTTTGGWKDPPSITSYGFWSNENDEVAIDYPATVTVVSKDGVNFNVTFNELGDKCGIHGLVAYAAIDESINTSYVINNCGRTRLVVGVMPR